VHDESHTDSGTIVTTTNVRRQINITHASILPVTERREMPWWCHRHLSPLFL